MTAVLHRFYSTRPSSLFKKPAEASVISLLVEMRRIELLSENDVTQLSPSADSDCFSTLPSSLTNFAKSIAEKISPKHYGATRQEYPALTSDTA